MMWWALVPVTVGFLLDLLLGDPQRLWHPVQGIGWLIAKGEPLLRRILPPSKKGELAAGAVLVLLVCGISWLLPTVLLLVLWHVHPVLAVVVESVFCWQILATKSLRVESMRVYTALTTGTLEQARAAVSRIVGRDTDQLDAAGVTRAAVETVAENTSDGSVAPLLFLLLGGAPLGFFYKAVNTLDSMIGYKSDNYLYFGRAAARLDDVMNYIPARLSALLMLCSAYLLGFDGANAERIFRRDRFNHQSPNSAQTESVCAGALRVQLAGDAFYFGKRVQKPTIGDALRPIQPEDIARANRLLYATAGLCFSIGFLVKLILLFLF